MRRMSNGYGQFCPVAKAAEIFATRWTPLILRELMSGMRSFNDLQRGLPLISRAVLVTRLRNLEMQGIIERRSRAGTGHEYRLTAAGEAFRPVVNELAHWGLAHGHERIEPRDLDPALLLWALRKGVDLSALPNRRITLRFEFSGVPAHRTKFRIMWLVLRADGVDVCLKDPGFAVDLILRGDIRDWVGLCLGRVTWHDLAGSKLRWEGDREAAAAFPRWMRLDAVDHKHDDALPKQLPRSARTTPRKRASVEIGLAD